MVDHHAALHMAGDDLVQVGLAADAIDHLGGADQHVGELALGVRRAGAEAAHAAGLGRLGGDARDLQLVLEQFAQAVLLGAAQAFAEDEFQGGLVVKGAVQGVLHQGDAFLDVAGEDLVGQVPGHPLVLHRHLARYGDSDDGFLAAPAGAAGLVDDDVLPARGLDVLAEFVQGLHGAGGMLAGGRPDLDLDLCRIPAFRQGRGCPPGQGLVEVAYLFFHRELPGSWVSELFVKFVSI